MGLCDVAKKNAGFENVKHHDMECFFGTTRWGREHTTFVELETLR